MAESGFALKKFIHDSKAVLVNPKEYFDTMTKEGGFGESIIKALFYGIIAGIIGFIWSLLNLYPGTDFVFGAGAGGIMIIIGAIITAIIGLFIGGIIVLIISAICGGSTGFEANIRITASLMILGPVNALLGIFSGINVTLGVIISFIVSLYGIYLLYQALVKALSAREGTSKIISVILIIVVIIILITGLGKTDKSSFISSSKSSDQSTSGTNWWSKFGEPKYGGTIRFAPTRFGADFDPFNSMYSAHMYYLEPLWIPDWKVDRNTWPFKSPYIPENYLSGLLAESWEAADPQTLIVHLRHGIRWQNKPPVNGREFTAHDVEFHYDRFLGTGNGFTEPSAMHIRRMSVIKKVTATDKYTVSFKFKTPSVLNFDIIMDQDGRNYILSPEVVKEYGDATDWKNAVGTGPWIVENNVADSVVTFKKNPDYWGYDERYPGNKLPYADKLKVHDIPDISTRIAALRTKKIDFLDEMALDQSRVLTRTNPKIQQAKVPFIASMGVDLRVDHKPFTDIRVRKALQMSVDRKKIAEQYYDGTVDGIPCGWVNPVQKGYNFPYEDWPKTLKDEYTYNPEKAKQLLTEAGYPNGFKTNIVTSSDHDVQLLQIIKAYFSEIGIDMKINEMEPAAAHHFVQSGKQDQMSWDRNTGSTATPTTMVRMNYSTAMTNSSRVNDSTYDKLCNKLRTTTSMDEAKKLTVKLDRHIVENHWAVRLFPINLYNVWNPYIKGYSGESMLRMGSPGGWFWARLWIGPE